MEVDADVPAFHATDLRGTPFEASDLIGRAPVLVALLRGLF
jgi:hypothetical protein